MKKLLCILVSLLALTGCSAGQAPSGDPASDSASDSASAAVSDTAGSSSGASTADSSEGGGASEPADPDAPRSFGRITVGAPALVYPDSEMPYTIDGSFSTLRQPDGSILYWETANGDRPYFYLHRGTAEDPLASLEATFAWDYNGYRVEWPSGVWVQNLYQCEDGTLIGFIHREDLERNNDAGANDYFTGLAISTDGGRNWTYGGDILSTVQNGDVSHNNMGGVPYLVVGDYFYIYFNEFSQTGAMYTSVARCRIDETVAALREGTVPAAEKYAGDGVWGVDGMTGTGTILVADSYSTGYDTHADAAYCAPLGRYLLTLQTHGLSKLLLYQSDDGLNWDDYEPIVLDQAQEGVFMQPYSTFVGLTEDASNDFSTVGDSFYIYFPRKGMGAGYAYDDLYRVLVTIDD